MTSWFAVNVLDFKCVILNQRCHQLIITLLRESFWNFSNVVFMTIKMGQEGFEVIFVYLDVFIVLRIGIRITLGFIIDLCVSPIIVDMTREGSIRM